MSQEETGLRLRTARRSRRLSVLKASELAGSSPSTIKRWERGRGLPPSRDLERYLHSIGAPEEIRVSPNDESSGRPVQRMLRSKRRRSALTLNEISLLTGICVASLHRYETGARAPDPPTLHRLAKAYGCTDEEASLLAFHTEPEAGSVVDGFLAPGGQPHFWLYRRLQQKLQPDSELTLEEAMDLVHGFMIMGDHWGLLEAWELMRPVLPQSSQPNEQTLTIGLSLALARYTVSGDKRQARARIGHFCKLDGTLPPNALSHIARLSAAVGDLEGAESWLDRLAFYAAGHQEPGQLFVSEVNRVLLAFSRTRSPRLLEALDRLRETVQGALQGYTLDVAELHMRTEMEERPSLTVALSRCEQSEHEYGFGSPLAARIRRRLHDG